jgi:hypothetical protein|uniref:Uncharacterized protein n=2 Tax=Picea TaxID=3328 RepID=A0A124GN80_PICGL|nr:hypothetical protein ABT39_MTgene4938 [Picea glauca]QHR92897.1 hypothetical protein Q903MT_gene6946 [Picea sitchensis]
MQSVDLRFTSLGLGGQVGVGPWLNGPGGSRCGGPGVTGLVFLDWWSFGVGGLLVTWFQSIKSNQSLLFGEDSSSSFLQLLIDRLAEDS